MVHTAMIPLVSHGVGHAGRMTILGLVLLAGCSAGGSGEGRLGSLAVEPELPSGSRSSGSPQGDACVPQVIRSPRPFRLADHPPRQTVRSLPPTRIMALGPRPSTGSIQTVAALEPIPEPAPLSAAEPAAAPAVAEIRDMLAGYLRAFNGGDAAAVAAHWALDGESLNLDSGERTVGREAVRDVFATLFASETSADLAIDVQEIRPVRADVAVVDGLARIDAASGPAAANRFSAVVVRDGDRWLVQSMREAAAEASAPRRHPLAELAWLVGFWEDEGEGVTAGTRCDWTAGRGFLLRHHVVAADGAATSLPQAGDERIPGLLPVRPAESAELTELIGWDPDREAIRSWIFSKDGRFAEATWHREGEGWSLLVEGRGADVGHDLQCRLLPDGPDGLVMQCDGDADALAGLIPPACSFSRTAR